MKHTLVIVIAFVCSISIKAQNTTFNKLYRPYNRVTNVTSIVSVDSFYYALFGDLDANNKQNYGILKFNKSGNIIDSSIVSTTNKYWGTDKPLGHGFILTSDSCFLYCGGIKDTAGWVNGFLAKFDLNMDTIWTKIFYHPDTLASLQKPTTSVMHLTDVKETPEGDYILIGNYNSDADGYEDRGFLLKLDTSGSIIWHKLNPSSVTILMDIEIDPVDSGYYYPAGRSVNAPQNISIFKTNSLGDVLWSKIVNHTQLPDYGQYPLDVELINDSVIVVVSGWERKVYEYNSWRNSVVATKINTLNQIIIWEKQYEFAYSRRDITLNQSIGANLTQDGNIAISATIIHPDSGIWNRGTILLINQNGDSLWQKYYAHNWEDSSNIDLQLNDLIVCDDGGFLFGGFVKDYSDGKIKSWLVKTDSLGITKAAFTLGIEDDRILVIKKQSPLLYPNPVYDNLNIQFDQISTNNYDLNIYSISGILVKHQKIGALSNEYRVNIQDLKSGIYLVSLISGGQLVYSQKIIKK
jgi:hypothetical protein